MATNTERRRRRPAVSCSLCRRRKIRCNRETPCSNCDRSKNQSCIYENDLSHVPWRNMPRLSESQLNNLNNSITASETSISSGEPTGPNISQILLATPSNSTPASTSASQSFTTEVNSLKNKVKELEEQLQKATGRTAHSCAETPTSTSTPNIETTSSTLAGTFSVHRENRLLGEAQAISRGVLHKSRLFGQSHWINGVAPFLRDLLELIEAGTQNTSQASSVMKRCKLLARAIKAQWTPLWPSPPTPELPPKDVADRLVDCYLRTTESVYRILHLPEFKRDYEALWAGGAVPETAFIVQLKLVFAIGSTTYDDQFSLRTSAVRWVYEAQTWLSEPEFKARLSLQSLQTNLLLLIARQRASVGASLVWISAGSLLRAAIYTGLHRDPACLPKSTILAAEMRRRLWNSILEITLQSSLDSGGSPLISLDDFDTEPPGNFDDDQLTVEDSLPAIENSYTETAIPIALRKTFPIRLAIARFLNNFRSSGTYEETLRLDASLRGAYRQLCQTLQGYRTRSGSLSPPQCALQTVNLIMNRYLLALHIPFFIPAVHDTTYTFSRNVAIDTSIKLWCAVWPSTSIMPTPSHTDMPSPAAGEDLARLTICGSEFFRATAMQASLMAAAELITQLQKEEGLSPLPLRPDLLAVITDARSWAFRSIEAGETNIKGYLFLCLISARIDGLIRGLGRDESSRLLIKTAEEAEERCLPILEQKAAQGQNREVLNQTSSSTPEGLEGWDAMMSFNFGSGEPVDWLFNDESMEGLSLW
ncbi:hypothetical protein AJ79_07080 [Helicocarpus griseus UAMH5409]|uniref:Zn(2)-C6 fungal-type domain-containing protein n=1 Tax=Helicocarpus griseus UAMH5409 TaxID=1447875 RepID=A0A2B7WYK9_9EURO|nr:hypothetical protein AJ79_07080 [Helicocarpus griseus UAMH5409]